jgi:hypothetical protein
MKKDRVNDIRARIQHRTKAEQKYLYDRLYDFLKGDQCKDWPDFGNWYEPDESDDMHTFFSSLDEYHVAR